MINFEMIVDTVKRSLDKYLEIPCEISMLWKTSKASTSLSKEYTEKLCNMIYHKLRDTGEEYNEYKLRKDI